MAVNNSLQSRSGGKPKFSVAIQTPMYQKLVNDTLGDPDRARRFVAAISSAVAVNPSLQECDAGTVLTAALLGESLNLSPSPQLGQYYMVPYKDKKRGTVAQFQLGYKGYIQLAERSGQYLDIDAFPVVEGEYRGRDRFTRRPILEFLEDDGDRESRPVVGYYAYFELNNGFRKVLYWSKDKMLAHADRYDELMLMLKAGQIRNLRLQQQYTLQESYITETGERVRAIHYVADFAYERPTAPDKYGTVFWLPVVEDVKSRATKTAQYEMKKKLLRERFNLTITEV